MWEDLVEAGWQVSVNTVAASMAHQGLVARSPKRKRRSLTRRDKAAAPIPDLVGRDFTAEAINQKWCGDLTEIPTDEGKLYLAIVEDLASRRLPGFAIGEHHDAPLAKAALLMAATVRGGDVTGVIFHTDKGGEYTGNLFTKVCTTLGVVQSMGRVASALDNAVAESFNSTLEWELLSRRHFATRTRPDARSPSSSTVTTTGASTARRPCCRRSPTKPSSPNKPPPTRPTPREPPASPPTMTSCPRTGERLPINQQLSTISGEAQ